MPELPEVETLRRQLAQELPMPALIREVKFSVHNLRTPMPRHQKDFFIGQSIVNIERRAKYLIFRFENGEGVLTHLGMTGSWRIENSSDLQKKHDHVVLDLENQNTRKSLALIYNDPRRFGFFEILKNHETHKLLKKLGAEPLSSDWSWQDLYEKVHTRSSPIKNLLMNAEIVVGVGNIYASEALFRAGISPLRLGCRIKKREAEKLKKSIVEILNEALIYGGSSIDDYRHLSGQKGQMQSRFSVYGRSKLPCLVCQHPVKKITQSGRSSFYCSKCQA
ncbi:MAG: bifunctional DNA-formamidopyrimidine glycosylase/DNA-(apurinic or apyrimidinic site) lyase [Bdellovibrionales bacterium]